MRTSVGENRLVRLADGSSVTLGGGTELQVASAPTTRRLELIRGEAFFAAKDASRPFAVRAGEANVTAVGTEFNVRRGVDRVVVAVIEGRVVVESAPTVAPIRWLRGQTIACGPVLVDAGQQTPARNTGVESVTMLADLAAATVWQNGRLASQREPLRYVLEDVNRYADKPIVLDDENIGELMITGTVLDDNVDGWVASIESVRLRCGQSRSGTASC